MQTLICIHSLVGNVIGMSVTYKYYVRHLSKLYSSRQSVKWKTYALVFSARPDYFPESFSACRLWLTPASSLRLAISSIAAAAAAVSGHFPANLQIPWSW